MSTVTIWLLISVGHAMSYAGSTPHQVIERFGTQAECERIQNMLRSQPRSTGVWCIQATVVKTSAAFASKEVA